MPANKAKVVPVKTGGGAPPPSLYGIDLGFTLGGRRILIVDDSAFNRKTLIRFLQWAGITQVEFADSSDALMAKVVAFDPDLVMIDTDSPAMDGVGMCKRLRREPRWRDLPILIQSALASDQHRTVCFQAGATDIIVKPINPGECIARVRYHLERRELVRELRGFRERIERDLLQARGMQLALVPEPEATQALGDRYGLDVEGVFRTSDEIGGDFWTVFEIDATRFGVFVADLSGHGITAAINAFRLHTLLNRQRVEDLLDPAGLLSEINGRLNEILPVGQFATAFYGIIDPSSDMLTYASAGAPSPILGDGQGFTTLDSAGMFLGAFREAEFDTIRQPFLAGQSLFLYSDGLTEARDADDAMLNEDGLIRLLIDTTAIQPERPLEPMIDVFTQRYGTHLRDDLTAVWLRRR